MGYVLVMTVIISGASDASASATSTGGNTSITSFRRAKRLMYDVHAGHRLTLYCGCGFDAQKIVAHDSCGYVPRSAGNRRAHRTEAEHVVPAHAFCQSFVEWREGHPDCVDNRGKPFRGRDCARRISMVFRLMEADMHNLRPAIGEVNQLRSNYSMAEIAGERREFGACDVEIAERKVEPRDAVRGDIARTYLYMDAVYPGRGVVSRKNGPLFAAWARIDPVDSWECQRARRIARVQGNANHVVEQACDRAGL